jgi:hypothetical protein
MARIVLGSYMVRYPLGGMLSWVLQYIVGLQRLGHDVWFVERSHGPGACFDPSRGTMGDDCSYGTRVVGELLAGVGLERRWCFVDELGRYHGMARRAIEAVLDAADLLLDMGTHGGWLPQAAGCRLRVLIDGEPGFTQARLAARRAAGAELPRYDAWYTTGRNAGTAAWNGPDGGVAWQPLFHPVVVDDFPCVPPPPDAPFTTLLNWRSYAPVRDGERVLEHKDRSFAAFLDLPRRVGGGLELAICGKAPRDLLAANGWRLASGETVSRTVDSFHAYVLGSLAEFAVAKHGFVAARTGWFSDRGAAYLASGRPVVQQDTGFGAHLPCGEGLFAVADAAQAAAAIDAIRSDPRRHGRAAREIAREFLDAARVLGGMLAELGVEECAARGSIHSQEQS